jgi:hypothetical protein
MSFWDNKAWHYLLHERFGEVLFYYLVRIRPFNREKAKEQLEHLLKERHLGSVRIFPIFGPYDLLIRAWLHPSIETQFRTWVQDTLQHCRALHPFAVNYIEYRGYSGGKSINDKLIDRELLENLNSSSVQAVQSGNDIRLYEELKAGHLIIERDKKEFNSIRYFVTISTDERMNPVQGDLVRRIKDFLMSNDYIESPSLYSGWGFCSVLFKGQVQDYFRLQKLPNWIGKEFAEYGVNTETYLAHDPSPLVGDESIGEATFQAISGKNLFVQSIIPEIYEKQYSQRHEVIQFLDELGHSLENNGYLTKRDKKLLHDYLIGFLEDDSTKMAQTVFIFFYALENYLRETLPEFVAVVNFP